MHRFLLPEPIGEEVQINGDEGHHLSRVLRLVPGDLIEVTAGDGLAWQVRLTHVGPGGGQGLRLGPAPSGEAPVFLRVFQGVARGEKMDWIIQKLTEIGVAQITPVLTQRTQVQLKGKEPKRQERWARIALEAMKQSRRSRIPQVDLPLSFAEAVRQWQEQAGPRLVLWEEDRQRGLMEVLEDKGRVVSLFIGPEGGLTSEEAQALRQAGGEWVGLGPRILRTETAALVAASLVLGSLGDLGRGME